jgi:hypothetical protein
MVKGPDEALQKCIEKSRFRTRFLRQVKALFHGSLCQWCETYKFCDKRRPATRANSASPSGVAANWRNASSSRAQTFAKVICSKWATGTPVPSDRRCNRSGAGSLDHPENRQLFLLKGAPTGCALEPPTAGSASLDLIRPENPIDIIGNSYENFYRF